MPSDVLDYVRSKDPAFVQVPDDELTRYLADRQPEFLQDPQFKQDYNKLIAGDVVNTVNAGITAAARTQAMLEDPAVRAAANYSAANEDLARIQEIAQRHEPAQPPESPFEVVQGLAASGIAAIPGGAKTLTPPTIASAAEVGQVSATTPSTFNLDKPLVELVAPLTAEQESNLAQEHPKLLGVFQSVRENANQLTTPKNLALLGAGMGVGSLGPMAARAVSLGFAVMMGKQVPEIAAQLGEEYAKPEDQRDQTKIAKLISDATVATGFSALAGAHGVKPEPGPGAKLANVISKQVKTAEMPNVDIEAVRSVAPLTAKALEQTNVKTETARTGNVGGDALANVEAAPPTPETKAPPVAPVKAGQEIPPEPVPVEQPVYRPLGDNRFESDSPPPANAINVSKFTVNGKTTYTFRLPEQPGAPAPQPKETSAVHTESPQILRPVREQPAKGENEMPPKGAGHENDEGGGQAPVSKGQVTPLADAWDKFDNTGEIKTVSELADHVEGLITEGKAPESLQGAVDKYRDAVEEDFKMAGRGDLENDEARFTKTVQKAAAKESKTTKQEIKKVIPPSKLSTSNVAKTVEEKSFRATAEGQKAMASRASRIALLNQINESIRKIDPQEAYDKSLIESVPDSQIDAWRDDLIASYNKLKKPLPPTDVPPGQSGQPEPIKPFKAGESIYNKEQALGKFAQEKILSAPSFPKLLQAAKSAAKSIHGKVAENFEEMKRQEPWDLLTAHSGIMNAKSARAKTLQRLADAVISEAGLPMMKGGKFRGQEYSIDWDKFREQVNAEKPLIGMGGAVKEEFRGGAGKDIYGVAQRIREERAKSGQVIEIRPGTGTTAPAEIIRGRELLAKDPAAGQKALTAFEANKSISRDGFAAARAYGEDLAQAARRIEEKFGTDSTEYRMAWKALSDWDERTKPMQTEWHKIGMGQQGETDIDTGSFTGIQRAFKQATGQDLNEPQAAKAKRLAKDVESADKAAQASKAKLQPEIDKIGKPVEPHVRLIADKLKEYFSSRAARALERIKARRAEGRLFTGIDPQEMVDYADYGASKIIEKGIQGAEMSAEWATEMVAELGDYIKPHLKEIWAAAQKTFDEQLRKVAGVSAEKVKASTKRTVAPTDIIGQQKVFSTYEPSKEMTPEQTKTLWNRIKSYIDQGNQSRADIVHKVAEDLGIPVNDVLKGMAKSRSVKRVADDVWQKQRQARILKNAAKNWIETSQQTALSKAIPMAVRLMFTAKTGFHGTVAIGTHAALEVATHPIITAKNFGKMYKLVASPQYYEMQIHELAQRPNYNVAQRAGLVNDMSKMEDFNDPKLAQGFPKLAAWFRDKLDKVHLGRMVGMGTRGYSVLKILRQDLFDHEWDKLADSQKSPEMAKAIADSVNHMTGVVKVGSHPAANIALFAPKLLLSRLSVMVGDPARAINSLTKLGNMTPAEKWFAVNQFKEKAKIAGVAFSLLMANQTLNNLFGDKRKINGIPESLGGGGFDPMASDFMKFRVAGMKVAWGSPFLTLMRLPLRLIQIGMSGGGKTKYLIYPDEHMYKTVGSYLRTQESPFLSPLVSLVTKADYAGRPLPQIPGYGPPPPVPKRLAAQGIKPYTWKEFGLETILPIPFEEGAREIFRYGLGASPKEQEAMRKAFIITALMAATGARATEDTAPIEGAAGQ